MKKPLEYRPIPGPYDGRTALNIARPGEFIENKEFLVFVGGSGVASASSATEAKKVLLVEAKRYCRRRIEAARAEIAHYEREIAKLEAEGLVPL